MACAALTVLTARSEELISDTARRVGGGYDADLSKHRSRRPETRCRRSDESVREVDGQCTAGCGFDDVGA